LVDREAGEKVNDALRTAAGLLQPLEIRQRREALGINQKALAAHLGIVPTTLSRWEPGAQIQQRGFDKLLRLYFALRRQEEEAERLLAEMPPLDVGRLMAASKSHSPSVVLPIICLAEGKPAT